MSSIAAVSAVSQLICVASKSTLNVVGLLLSHFFFSLCWYVIDIIYVINGNLCTQHITPEYEVNLDFMWLTMAVTCSWKYNKQVAQLWQRDRAKLDTFWINVQHYSQNHAQNWIFGSPYGGIRGNISALSESFDANKLCSRVSWRECQFFS